MTDRLAALEAIRVAAQDVADINDYLGGGERLRRALDAYDALSSSDGVAMVVQPSANPCPGCDADQPSNDRPVYVPPRPVDPWPAHPPMQPW